MATLQDRGRITLARSIAAASIHLAWGRGLPAWDIAPEPEPTNEVGLVDEIGRRTVTQVSYVVPAADGEIELVSGRYTLSAEPTKWLFVRFTFEFADAANETIREVAVFVGSQPVEGLPAGQRYFTPAQIANPGEIYALERQPFQRTGGVREVFEYVLPF